MAGNDSQLRKPPRTGGASGAPSLDDFMTAAPTPGSTTESAGRPDGRQLYGAPSNRPPIGQTDTRAAFAAASTPEAIAEIQAALASIGILSGQYAYGIWDAKSVAAYRDLNAFAKFVGLPVSEAFQVYSDQRAAGWRPNGQSLESYSGPGGEEFAPQVTSTEDLTLAIKDASSALRAGGAFDDNTIARLVSVYQAQEAEEQRAAFNAELHGGTVEAPTSAETMLRNTIREADPAGVGAREVAERYNDFKAMLANNGLGPVKL